MGKNNITKIEHVWCEDDDRWVYIDYDANNKVNGINFMQGNEYELFKERWSYANKSLTEFYFEMIDLMHVEFVSCTRLEFINKCIWAWFQARDYYKDYKQETFVKITNKI